ncbi:MAG: hypothetical protein EZS28_018826, partial [Streblomastix strix]
MSVDLNSQSSSSQQEPHHHDIPVVISETSRLQKSVLSHTQKLQISKLPRDFKDVLNDDADNYTQLDDGLMESKGCEVYVDERSGEVTERFRGEVQAVVKENGLYAPDIGEILQCGFFEFEDDEELGILSACVLADAAELKQAQLQSLNQSQSQNMTFRSKKQPTKWNKPLNNMVSAKRKLNGSVLMQDQRQNLLQMQFQQQKQQYSKFNSLQDKKVAQDLVSSFQGVLKKDASKVDLLNYTLEPFARQKLFDETSLKGTKVIFPMPEVGPLLPEQKAGYARRALESSAAEFQGMAGLIHKVAQGDTDNLVGKMFKIFEASVMSVSDAQVERESRLEDVFQGPQTEDVLTQKTKETFKRKSAKQVIDRRKGLITRSEDQLSSSKSERDRAGDTIYSSKKRDFNRELKSKNFKDTTNTTFTPNQHHFTAKSNPSSRLKRIDINAQQNSIQQSISSKSGEQIEAVCWERNSFDPAEELNKAVCWEHVSFDPAKDVERAGCGDQGSTDLAVGCGDQGSTNLAINQDERAGCGDQGSTNLAINQDERAGCGDQG